jgi:hypothetical protein
MADPLSIAMSAIALIEVAKKLADFISDIREAPTNLESTKKDICLIINVVEELQGRLPIKEVTGPASGNGIPHQPALKAALDRCKGTCDTLHDMVAGCTRHSSSKAGRIFDSAKLAARKKDFDRLRTEISLSLQIMAVAAMAFHMTSSEADRDKLATYLSQGAAAIDNVNANLYNMKREIQVIQENGFEIGGDLKEKLDRHEAALTGLLELCKESVQAVKEERQFDVEIGDTKTTHGSRAAVGHDIQLAETASSVRLKIGNTTTEDKSTSVVGSWGQGTVARFSEYSAGANAGSAILKVPQQAAAAPGGARMPARFDRESLRIEPAPERAYSSVAERVMAGREEVCSDS